MTARALFKEADLTRALRAAEKAKVPVRVEIEQGRMIVTMVGAKMPESGANMLDEMFA